MSYKRRVADLERRLNRIADVVQVLRAPGLVEDLVRRGQHPARDAYPSQSIPEFVSGSGTSNPTLSKALMDEDWPDRVGEALADLEAEIITAQSCLNRAEHLKEYVEGIGYKADKRAAALSTCDCCERDVANTPVDRIKGGLCPACYTAWLRARADDPQCDKARFIYDRRQELAAEEVRRRRVS